MSEALNQKMSAMLNGYNFNQTLDAWIKDCQALVDAYWTRNGFDKSEHMKSFKPELRKTEGGKRYIRIVTFENNQSRSVYCFIDTTNGDVLKGSWKSPVKNGVRGNIFSGESVNKYMSEHGPIYLR